MENKIILTSFKESSRYYTEVELKVPDKFYKKAKELMKEDEPCRKDLTELQFNFRDYLNNKADKYTTLVCIPVDGTLEDILLGFPIMILPKHNKEGVI